MHSISDRIRKWKESLILLLKFRRYRNRHVFLFDVLGTILTTHLIFVALRTPLKHYLFLVAYTFISILLKTIVFWSNGLYKRHWYAVDTDDVIHITRATFIAASVLFAVFLLASTIGLLQAQLPLALPLLDGALTVFVASLTRITPYIMHSKKKAYDNARRLLILGAGIAGQTLVTELRRSSQQTLLPVGFIDDDIHKHLLRINGLPVLGPISGIPTIIKKYNIDEVVIAMPTASGATIRDCLALCAKAGVPTKIIPSLSGILNQKIDLTRLRDVDVQDLLRREVVSVDLQPISQLIEGKRVLVTGAGGSIGSELCRQILMAHPSDLACLGHGENTIFDINNELIAYINDHFTEANKVPPRVRPYIADIRISNRINSIFEEFQPDIVFHAAAHKHVPLMEANPTEAIANNVLGTRNLLEGALKCGTKHFVMISTDKAVRPSSVMGASKRVAEMLVMYYYQKHKLKYAVVRFGNVLGSRGSVVPIFKRQIASGGPVTVSHPDMRRYFMTIPEAVQLVLQSCLLGHGGELFMLDMGEPIHIVDIANDLIRLSGLEPGRDIQVKFTGIRPGEKMSEELLLNGEEYDKTQHEKIYTVRGTSDLIPDNFHSVLQMLEQAVEDDDNEAVLRGLYALVNDFKSSDMGQVK